MLFRLFSLSTVFVSLFFLGACSDAPSKPTAAVKRDVTVAKAVLKTSGILRFDGLPAESISAAEVLVVSVLSDVARERILRQRELFENKITGRIEDSAGVSSIEGMSPADAMKLEASLETLRSQFLQSALRMSIWVINDCGNIRAMRCCSKSISIYSPRSNGITLGVV